MEFFLIKDRTVQFKYDGIIKEQIPLSCQTSEPFPVVLEPVNQECEDSKEYSKMITKKAKCGLGCKSDFDLVRKIRLCLHLPIYTTSGRMNIVECSHPKKEAFVFGTLLRLFGTRNLSFHLTIKDLNITYSCGCVSTVNLESNAGDLGRSLISIIRINFPEHELHPEATIEGTHPSQCRISLTVKLSQRGLTKVPLERHPPYNPGATNKRLLDEAVGSDLVVVASNGTEVKCHKCHLMVSCDDFRAMFENKMKEDTTNRLEMPDMSEAGVRAFLNFIYTSDVEAASRDCDIALELFRAGDKYRMSSLKNEIKTMICFKPAEWFNVDTAIRLCLLVQNLEGKEEIFKKMAEVLKWYSKNKSVELLASEEYEGLFRTEPRIGMELFKLFFEFS